MTQDAGRLAGKTAIVTGGSRGIGRAIVERLAGDGATVVFSYASNEAQAKEVIDAVAEGGGHAWAVQCQLDDLSQLENLFISADGHLAEIGQSGLDILVNNAGTFVRTPMGTTTEADFDRQMAVNAKAPFFAMQHAVSRMPDGGRIINISTITTRAPRVTEAVYAASKASIEQFSWIAARELGERGITINVVSPGPTDAGVLNGATSAEERVQVAKAIPLWHRLGQPVDIANVVAFLAGPDGEWVTGQNIRADGGLTY